MRWLLVLTLLLAAQLQAADFRTTDFGDSCALIANREAALGNEPIKWGEDNANVRAFKAHEFGRDVPVVYVCLKGVLRLGNYFFPQQEKDAALETLRATYDGLISTYGVPFLDSTPWQYGEGTIHPWVVASEPQGYRASWKTPTISFYTALMLRGDQAGPNWGVIVVFSKNEEKTPRRATEDSEKRN